MNIYLQYRKRWVLKISFSRKQKVVTEIIILIKPKLVGVIFQNFSITKKGVCYLDKKEYTHIFDKLYSSSQTSVTKEMDTGSTYSRTTLNERHNKQIFPGILV